MDWFRALLIVAIAVLGWNLIFQWNQDYGHNAALDDSRSLIQPDTITPAPSNTASTGSKPTVKNQINEALKPSIDKNSQVQPKSLPEASKPINVTTDTFTVDIDLNGGDMVYLALRQYPKTVEQPDQPFVMFVSNDSIKYIAESGIIGASSTDLDGEGARPLFEAKQSSYKLKGDQLVVPLTYTNPAGVQFEKRYIFTKNSYEIKIEYQVTNQTAEDWLGRPYGRLRRSDFSDPSETGGFGLPTFLGVAYWDPEERFTKVDFDDIAEAEKAKPVLNKSMEGGWAGILQHYFVAAWTPNPEQTNLYRANYNQDSNVPGGGEYVIDAVVPQITVQPGHTETVSQSLYVGPKIQEKLKKAAEGLNLVVDYGPLFFISDLLMFILKFIYSIVGNYGFSIILLTLFVKACLFPLSAKGYKSMAHMRDMQPKMAELKKKFGDDRQKMSEELMRMYKEEGVNPLGGCLPMLLQMPVFLALYWALLESVELRQAPFILWINDLSLMDPYFLLPLLMGVSMWFQQKLNPTPPDPMQAKVMKFMPIGMTFLFLFFPAGLVLYWVTNNVLSITQQAYITKKVSKI